MSHRKKLRHLTQPEIEQFLLDAERLNKTICRPSISPQCEHSHSLQKLNEALILAILEITGRQAPWILKSSTGPARPKAPPEA
ncbi:MAG TPA: hypothetical protein VGX71_05495 [Pseudaminobacter sp.]|nr:hypothetical protein [Pseudaminobacter sp.]